MADENPPIEVRALDATDAPLLQGLDYSFETDLIYSLRVRGPMAQDPVEGAGDSPNGPALAFELFETQVDPPFYRNYLAFESTLEHVEAVLRSAEGGYIALALGKAAGVILLKVDEEHKVARIEQIIVGRQYRRYGIGSLLLSCAADWARKRGCRAILLEIQNVNYPAVQFYLRNGLEVWSIHRHFYAPGSNEHEVALFMGKSVSPTA